MNRHMALVGKAAGHGVFKGAALVGAFLIIVGAWWWDASLLTAAADENLRLIKTVTAVLPVDWGSKVESALRIFGADRALLLVEGIVIAKVVMLGIAHPFRHRRPWETNISAGRARHFRAGLSHVLSCCRGELRLLCEIPADRVKTRPER